MIVSNNKNIYINKQDRRGKMSIKDVLDLTEEEHTELALVDDFYIEPENGGEYRLIHKDDIFAIYTAEIIELIKDCYNLELPDFVEVDWGTTVNNCLADGYGHHFSSHDGSEEFAENYYIFRVN